MTRASFTIAIPIKDLSNTNKTEIWRVSGPKRKMLRQFIADAAQGLPHVEAPARGVVTFVWPDKINRDPDNYSLKGLWDGLVDAGVLSDDNGQILRTTIRFAAPWRHNLGRSVVVLGVKVEQLEGGEHTWDG